MTLLPVPSHGTQIWLEDDRPVPWHAAQVSTIGFGLGTGYFGLGTSDMMCSRDYPAELLPGRFLPGLASAGRC